MSDRGSGILLHVTSLPSPHGIGDLGPAAFGFVDFLASAGMRYWQVLPLGPTDAGLGNSPYSGGSAFAGNTLLISPEFLVRDGYLSLREIEHAPGPAGRVDYNAAGASKRMLLNAAFSNARDELLDLEGFLDFCDGSSGWLEDHALFVALKEQLGGVEWTRWPEALRDRRDEALNEWKVKLAERMMMERCWQFLFHTQWLSLKDYCNFKGVNVIGDAPFYVTHDSADVWAHRRLFNLGDDGRPGAVAGVPPDYFSRTGQLWGNPTYRWGALKETGYRWWTDRLARNLELYDLVRLDHFRGFASHWEIPAGERTAEHGKWVNGPGEDFFRAAAGRLGGLPFIAEDLGYITKDVEELRDRFGLPGNRVLQFAFGDEGALHRPHNYVANCFAYTGTHDNETLVGWLREPGGQRQRALRYVGSELAGEGIQWRFIRLLMKSVARGVIVPMQDVLGLGNEARMNTPGITGGNWEWRLSGGELTAELAARLADLNRLYDRI